MGKLKYKDKKEKKEKREHRKPKEYYRPPKLYEVEEGYVNNSIEDTSWREHLFEAMMEDEGEDPFYSRYDYYGNNTTRHNNMTDEEYRQYIVSEMYKKTHSEEIKAEEDRKARKKKEEKERKNKLKKEQEERERIESIYRQLENVKKNANKKKEYVDQWMMIEGGSAVIKKKDIPWPIVGNEVSLNAIRSFIVDPNASLSDNKKHIRKEQMRYHPDKFISRVISRLESTDKEQKYIINRMNEVSSLLNELWTHMNIS